MKNLYFIISLIAILFVQQLGAQAPFKFNYQAVVRNDTGIVAGKSMNFRVKILNVSDAVLYQEEHNASTDPFGLVSLQIGAGQPTPVGSSLADIEWGSGGRYLLVETDYGSNNFQPIGQKVQLVSVPYALYAEKSGDGGGGTTYTAGDGISISSSNEINSTTWEKSGSDVVLATTTNDVAIGINDADNYKLRIRHGNFGLRLENRNNLSDYFWELYVHEDYPNNLELWGSDNDDITLLGFFSGTTGFYSPGSDKRLKTNIKPLDKVLLSVKKLIPSQYEMIHDTKNKKSIGLIAQEVQTVFPELVNQSSDRNGESYLALNYSSLSVIAIKAIQEQQAIIEELSTKVKELESKLSEHLDKK